MSQEQGGTEAVPQSVRPIDADVLVIGGGASGLIFALTLAQAGVRTCLVDPKPPAAPSVADGRGWAIAYGSQLVLRDAGIWPFAAAAAQPILEIRVADNNAPLFLHYDHREAGDQPFGWIIESRLLVEALERRAEDFTRAGAGQAPPLIRMSASVAQVARDQESAVATLTDGRRIRARLAVGADGRGSVLRREAGLRSVDWRYDQDAITLTVAHQEPHRGIAVEHFLPAGPFAILPMIDDPDGCHRSSIVWTERRAEADRIMTLDDAEFHTELARRFGDFLGPLKIQGDRFRYPLSVSYAPRITAQRLAFIGDAAHAIHPIAGQGLNLGIRGAALLASLVIDACRLGLDPGASALLARYQRDRRFDIITLTAVTDGLNRLFSNDLRPLKLIRDLGLAAVGTAPLTPLRKVLMRHAMGLPILSPRI